VLKKYGNVTRSALFLRTAGIDLFLELSGSQVGFVPPRGPTGRNPVTLQTELRSKGYTRGRAFLVEDEQSRLPKRRARLLTYSM